MQFARVSDKQLFRFYFRLLCDFCVVFRLPYDFCVIIICFVVNQPFSSPWTSCVLIERWFPCGETLDC